MVRCHTQIINIFIFAFSVLFASSGYALKVGDLAPDFALEGTDGQIHRLSDYKGKTHVIVAWFPKAYTRGCTIECKSLAENSIELRKFNVMYFMASVDPIEDNLGFAVQQQADFPLLSDPSTHTALSYEVLSSRGYALRHTFYISPEGRILAIDTNVRPASSAEDMLMQMARLGVPFQKD